MNENQDVKAPKEQREDIQEQRKDIKEDRKEAKEPRKDTQEQRKDSKEDRKETKEPRKETKEDRKDTKEPRKDNRGPRRDNRGPRKDNKESKRLPKEAKVERREIVVNANPFETRIAKVEDGKLVEFYVERIKDKGLTGNVYKGTVVRVLPGMQAAFVEVGLDRTAFLHVSDITDPFADFDDVEDKDGGQPKDAKQGKDANDKSARGRGRGRGRGRENSEPGRIQDKIKEGQKIVVQVAKEPIGTKGARVTSYVSLAGRYLVLMPTFSKIAVSRRIADDKERRRLKKIVSELRTEGYSFIIRTVCEGESRENIKADMDYLVKLWESIKFRSENMKAPARLYEELDLSLRTVRDSFSVDVDKLIIDSPEEFKRASDFVNEFMPALSDRLEKFESEDPIFDAHGVEIEISDALDKKVWLKSGGHLIIDQMEALTAVDVNTGKYVGKKNSEETVTRTNLEAVKEVVYQLRLRNIGGIIVIDFIDMGKAQNRAKVYNALNLALKKDKAKTNILKVSEFGIIEMTRKRTRESIGQALCEPCKY
ncbi:MAG: Rne/Rng family ribonuclease, partial [Proteobacteria bacterium]|nr:Rne/Rng family ribonuclease [Pseudomonadota bacterium]